jgi:hypothetical protein
MQMCVGVALVLTLSPLPTVQDDENCRTMLEQPGSEVVLLQLGSMLQLASMQEGVALDAAWSAVEALWSVTRFPEGCRQLLAKGSLPGRVRSLPLQPFDAFTWYNIKRASPAPRIAGTDTYAYSCFKPRQTFRRIRCTVGADLALI